MGRKKIDIHKYREQLDNKYGPEFTLDFDSVFKRDISLAQISVKYNISKMWASKLFERLYGRTFRKAMAAGFAKDPAGKVHRFDKSSSKHILVILPPDLHNDLKEYSAKLGLSMSVVIRDCISQLFKDDGMTRLSRFF